MILEGKSHVFGDHVNTDYIISSKAKSRYSSINELVAHLMEDIRPGFYEQIEEGDFIVAGINFGCGSSRETAPWVIKESGIAGVIAQSFARIFFRNAINIGLPVIVLDTHFINDGDLLHLDLYRGMVENISQAQIMASKPLPTFIQGILDAGGVKKYLKLHGRFST